jgi:hypothetical protein
MFIGVQGVQNIFLRETEIRHVLPVVPTSVILFGSPSLFAHSPRNLTAKEGSIFVLQLIFDIISFKTLMTRINRSLFKY